MNHKSQFRATRQLSRCLRLSIVNLSRIVRVLRLPINHLPIRLSFTLRFNSHYAVTQHFINVRHNELFPILRTSRNLTRRPLHYLNTTNQQRMRVSHITPLISYPMRMNPLTPRLSMNFVRTPTQVGTAPPRPTRPLLRLQNMTLSPTVSHHVISQGTTFHRRFLGITVTSQVTAVPTRHPRSRVALRVTPLRVHRHSIHPVSTGRTRTSQFLRRDPRRC